MFEKISLCQQTGYQAHYKILCSRVDVAQLDFHSSSRNHYKYTHVINWMNSQHLQITQFNSQFALNY